MALPLSQLRPLTHTVLERQAALVSELHSHHRPARQQRAMRSESETSVESHETVSALGYTERGLTFPSGQASVVSHGAEVLEDENGDGGHDEQHDEHHHPDGGAERLCGRRGQSSGTRSGTRPRYQGRQGAQRSPAGSPRNPPSRESDHSNEASHCGFNRLHHPSFYKTDEVFDKAAYNRIKIGKSI